MNVTIDLVNACRDDSIPSPSEFSRWTLATMKSINPGRAACELCIRVVDEEESADLNQTWRRKSGATNVLSFPFTAIAPEQATVLGDLAICAPVVRREAATQNKTLKAHWAHLTVHGVLHLNGYDHENAEAALIMENLEISILNTLGFDDPYQAM